MKYFKHITIISALLFLVSACTDFVDYEPKEDFIITEDVYFQSASDYEAAVVGTYDPLQWMYLNILIGDIASDNSLSGGESATDVVGLQQIDDMVHNPSNDNLTSIWKWCYEGINRANYLEQNKSKLTFDGKEQLYGEVYFLRAYYYFELVKFFGDVPVFTEARLTAGDSANKDRKPASEVYEQIVADLEAAISVLPGAGSTQKGRANKHAAHALLGKVYLYQKEYAKAAAELEKVIGVYSLVDDYGSQFLRAGENGSESVFEVQHTNTSNWWDWGYTPQGGEGNFGVIHNGPRGYVGPTYASGWSFNVPTADLYNSFDADDTRRDVSVLDIAAFAAAEGAEYAEGYKHTGYFNNKYIPRAGESGAQAELNYLTNYRSIRYADVLLMAAEAYNSGNLGDDTARGYLNEVRRRGFGYPINEPSPYDITSSDNDLRDAIFAERNFELSMEGHRFFDLVRTGRAAGVIDGFVTGKHELFPIPQQEMDISGWDTNNPGY